VLLKDTLHTLWTTVVTQAEDTEYTEIYRDHEICTNTIGVGYGRDTHRGSLVAFADGTHELWTYCGGRHTGQ